MTRLRSAGDRDHPVEVGRAVRALAAHAARLAQGGSRAVRELKATIFLVYRVTGWGRVWDHVALRDLATELDVSERTASRLLRRLEEACVITYEPGVGRGLLGTVRIHTDHETRPVAGEAGALLTAGATERAPKGRQVAEQVATLSGLGAVARSPEGRQVPTARAGSAAEGRQAADAVVAPTTCVLTNHLGTGPGDRGTGAVLTDEMQTYVRSLVEAVGRFVGTPSFERLACDRLGSHAVELTARGVGAREAVSAAEGVASGGIAGTDGTGRDHTLSRLAWRLGRLLDPDNPTLFPSERAVLGVGASAPVRDLMKQAGSWDALLADCRDRKGLIAFLAEHGDDPDVAAVRELSSAAKLALLPADDYPVAHALGVFPQTVEAVESAVRTYRCTA